MRSLKFKILIIISIIFITLFVLEWSFVNFYLKEMMEKQAINNIIGIGKYIASNIDINLIQTFPEYERTPSYRKLRNFLLKFQRFFHIDNIIVINTKKRVIIDLQKNFNNGEEYLYIDIDDQQFQHLRRGNIQTSSLYKNNFGKYAENIYIPIGINKNFKGVLILFASVKYFYLLEKMNKNMLYLFLTFLLLVLILSYIFSYSISNPFIKLSKVLQSIGKGNLNVHIPFLKRKDELGILSKSAQEMVKKLKVKDVFMRKLSASLAHEIRNPLTAIKGNLEILKRNTKNSNDIDLIEDSLKEVKSLEQLVNEFMDFAKPKEIKLDSVNIKNIVDDSISMTQKLAEIKNISIKNSVADVLIEGNATYLKSAIINLIKNSIEASNRNGDILIYHEKDKDYLKIMIEDHGVGIREEDLNSIFDPFFTQKSMGTGLGLSIVKEIIEKHNGLIEVRSKEGKYTIFTIYLRYYKGG